MSGAQCRCSVVNQEGSSCRRQMEVKGTELRRTLNLRRKRTMQSSSIDGDSGNGSGYHGGGGSRTRNSSGSSHLSSRPPAFGCTGGHCSISSTSGSLWGDVWAFSSMSIWLVRDHEGSPNSNKFIKGKGTRKSVIMGYDHSYPRIFYTIYCYESHSIYERITRYFMVTYT
jgi:hypothetical protein